MFLLAAINYIDRSALSVAAAPLAQEFKLDPVQMGYLFSSFLWFYVLCLVLMWAPSTYETAVAKYRLDCPDAGKNYA